MFRSMFQGRDEEPPWRYRTEIIDGHMRKQSHQAEVYDCLNTGERQGWRLVRDSTSNPMGTYFTTMYWYSVPKKKPTLLSRR